MPAATIVFDELFSAKPGNFTVQLKGEGLCAAHFRAGQIYFGPYQLTADQQKKFIALFSEAYNRVRQRNHAWRFLSSHFHYFTGQLYELEGMASDEGRIRYLFCHAEQDESNKTTEALKAILPAFYRSLLPSRENLVNLPRSYHMPTRDVLQSYKKHLEWMEEIFKSLWMFSSVKKVCISFYDYVNKKWFLAFTPDCRARIMSKSHVDFFIDKCSEREIVEAEWAKIFYEALDHFRRRIMHESNDLVLEIDKAFNVLIDKVLLDPPGLNLALLKNSEFYDVVLELRDQVRHIHMDWRTPFTTEAKPCALK